MEIPSSINPDCPRCRELLQLDRKLQRRVEQLEKQVATLTAALEAEQRRGKRQAAPFSKNEPAKKPRKPGRKPGGRHGPHAHRKAPPRIDETYDVPLPRCCPGCGAEKVAKTGVAVQYQVEIPRTVTCRQFNVDVGECHQCGNAVRGRHELQTSTAGGAAASQLGPRVHALLALLNKELGLSHGKSVRLLRMLFPELQVARATSVRSVLRTAKRLEGAHEQIRKDLPKAPEVAPDETGWRVGGRSAWLHAFVSARETCYVIDPGRGPQPAEELLGLDWAQTMVHDGWSVYDRFTRAMHQQCVGHLQRRCRQMLETAVAGAVRFPRAVLKRVDQAFALRPAWRGHRLGRDDLALCGLELSCQLQQLSEGKFRNVANRRLARHLLKHSMDWFWFLIDPTVQATNHWAERAIRPAVVNRKVWGGNRTWRGAQAQAILMSIIQTATQRGVEPFEFLQNTFCSPRQLYLPPDTVINYNNCNCRFRKYRVDFGRAG